MKIPILMYHQIDVPPPRGTPLRGLVVSPQSFKRQMLLLKWMGYTGLSMRNLEPYLCGERQGKVVGITFDDGYQNNLQYALPTLKKMGFSATCYAVSSMLGGQNSWDLGIGVAQKPLMSKENFLEWLAAGMDVGSHTKTHADLTAISFPSLVEEIQGSKIELESALGYEVRHFCYPYGRFNDSHLIQVQKSGYVTATTTQRGRVKLGEEQLKLKRVLISQATSPIHFSLKILSSYEDSRG
jgi:peptidoglycan/xylan/chitin deacetylase (PgdA/CDA1 family)